MRISDSIPPRDRGDRGDETGARGGAGPFHFLAATGPFKGDQDVVDWIWGPGFDAEGHLNGGRTAPPLPQWKNNAFINWSTGRHNVRLDLWHTDEYDDDRPFPPPLEPEPIDEHITVDVNYTLTLNDERTRLFVSIYNITDEDPPLAWLDNSYDPFTHDPFGIVFKVGVQHRLEGGPFQ